MSDNYRPSARRQGRELYSVALKRDRALRHRAPVLVFVACRVCGADLGETDVGTELFCAACRTWSTSLSTRKETT